MDSRSSRSCTGMATSSAREPSTLYCTVWKQAVTSIVKIASWGLYQAHQVLVTVAI
jgi:hypothetical protein